MTYPEKEILSHQEGYVKETGVVKQQLLNTKI